MLVYQFVGLFSGMGQYGVRLCVGLRNNGLLVINNLLVFLYLIRYPQAQFNQQFLQLFFIYLDLCMGKRCKIATVNIFFNLADQLFYPTHTFLSLLALL